MMMTLAGTLAGIGLSPTASAIPFSDFVDFNAGVDDFQTVSDSSTPVIRSWAHSILDDLNGNSISSVTLTDASLLFTFSRTNGNEDWSLNQGMGLLPDVGDIPETKLFVLGESALADLQLDGAITFTPSESTVGNDTFRRYDATLTGNYAVRQAQSSLDTGAPEPASAMLVGIGFTGLALLRRPRSALERRVQ